VGGQCRRAARAGARRRGAACGHRDAIEGRLRRRARAIDGGRTSNGLLRTSRKLVRELVVHRQVVLTGSKDARDQECIAPTAQHRRRAGCFRAAGLQPARHAAEEGRAVYRAGHVGVASRRSHRGAGHRDFGPTNPLRWAPRPATVEPRARVGPCRARAASRERHAAAKHIALRPVRPRGL